jgi:dienelactone hydrolase
MVLSPRHRFLKVFLVWMFLLVLGLPLATTAAPLSQQHPPTCLVFSQTGNFAVCDDTEAQFLSAHSRFGLQRIGYPISTRFERDGFVSQAFQKGIMQWRPDTGTVALVNIFDDLHHAGYDTALLDNYQTPLPLPDNWDAGRSFGEVVQRRQALLATRPALQRAYFSIGDPLTFFGLPTSEVQDMGNHYAIRLQRAVLQEWKEAVPWARAGEVTVSNGGEIAWALGLLPLDSELPTAAVVAAPATPDEWLTVAALRARSYGTEGAIERVRVMERPAGFTRYEIRYPSDGLMIGGFMNVPNGAGPFPVIFVNHGWMPTDSYVITTYTTKYADALAREGYLVLHTNYRNHRGSDTGPERFRVGYAIDVLNLIELTKQLPEADVNRMGMWGHSMGGGITLRVLAVTDDIKAALVYGSMSSDEAETIQRSRDRWLDRDDDPAEIEQRLRRAYPILPEDDPEYYRQISPFYHLQYVSAAVAIHHGVQDESVPYIWSERLRDELTRLGKSVEFYAYADQPHNFVGAGYNSLLARTNDFFNRHLK